MWALTTYTCINKGVSQMIGIKLRGVRQARALSLRQLAQKAGLSHSFLSDIEHGRCNPSIDTLYVIASALGIGPEFFLSQLVAVNEQKATAREGRQECEGRVGVPKPSQKRIRSTKGGRWTIQKSPRHFRQSSRRLENQDENRDNAETR